MKLDTAVDQFLTDWQSYGRINSPATIAAYRYALKCLSEDVSNRDPRTIGRQDIKRTLARWPHPNTQALRRAALNSFFKWTMQEGIRKDNPVDQTTPPKKRDPQVYRLTLEEVHRLATATITHRERWAIHLGLYAGFRNAEICTLKGRDFQRQGFVRVVGKGNRERWVPVIADLQPVWNEIHLAVDLDDYVFPGKRWRDPGNNTIQKNAKRPMSTDGMRKLVHRVVNRAGLNARVTPHTLRHAFGDHIARYAGIRNAQSLLGHKDIGTTQVYMNKPTLDELTAAVAGMSFRLPLENKVPQGPNGSNARESALSGSRTVEDFGRMLMALREAFE
jgi:site-specific recombinase XerD